MPQEFKIDNTVQFSQVISLEDRNEHMIKNTPNERSSKSIMIDVLLMLLCERSDRTPEPEITDIDSD